MHGSGFLAVYLAGLVVGNSATRAHNTVVAFLDAATWLAQIAMFVLLGLLAWPDRLPRHDPGRRSAWPLALMLVARPGGRVPVPCAVPLPLREKLFMSWVGLRGAVGIFLASIPLLVGLPNAQLYFDVGFVVVLVSLLVQGWTIAPAARWLRLRFRRSDPLPRRVELDLPGQLEQELVGYPLSANSPYLRRGMLPSWAQPTLVVRDEQILSPAEADRVRAGDYVYLLAPPEKAAGARPLLRRPAAAGAARSAAAGRLLRGRRRHARRAGGDLRPAPSRRATPRMIAGGSFRRAAQCARRKAGRRAAARDHRAGRAPGGRRPRHQRRPAAGGRRSPPTAPTMWIARMKSIARRVLAKLG